MRESKEFAHTHHEYPFTLGVETVGGVVSTPISVVEAEGPLVIDQSSSPLPIDPYGPSGGSWLDQVTEQFEPDAVDVPIGVQLQYLHCCTKG